MAQYDEGVLPVKLIGLRTLRNDSVVPENVKYQLFTAQEIATYQENTGNLVLQSLPKNGKYIPIYILLPKEILFSYNIAERIIQVVKKYFRYLLYLSVNS